jgi:hypothetical protein
VWKQELGLVWISDGGSIFYFVGNNDVAARIYCENPTQEEFNELMEFTKRLHEQPAFKLAQSLPPAERSKVFFRAGLDWDRQHLRKLPRLVMAKFIGYWRPWVNPAGYPRSTVLISLTSLPIIAFGLLGLGLKIRDGERILSAVCLQHMIAGSAVAALMSTEIRYRVPIVDVLLVNFAAVGASYCSQRACMFLARSSDRPRSSSGIRI